MRTAALRRHLPALGIILAAAFALRLAWAVYVHPDPTDGRFDDTAWYRQAAYYFANGDGYVNPFTGTPTAAWPPGYPVFLGSVFKLFGVGTWQTYGANIALSLLTIVAAYYIGLRLFDRRAAIIGAAALAMWPGQVYFTSLTLSEPLFTFLFVGAIALMVARPARREWRLATTIAFAIAAGLAALTRGQALLLLPLALLYWRLAGDRWRWALDGVLLSSLVVVVMFGPWVARNVRELGSPVIISTNLGPNLWIGHHDGATGRMQIPEPEPPLPSRDGRTQPEYEVAADRLALRKGLAYMFTHPLDEVRLSATKIRAMYESDATAIDWNSGYGRDGDLYASDTVEARLRDIANGFWFMALILSGVGLISMRSRRHRGWAMLPALVLSWTATHLLFFGDPRFHYPLVFAFALLGAQGVVAVYDALRRPEPRLDERYVAA